MNEDKGKQIVRLQLNKAFEKEAYRALTEEDVEGAVRRVFDELGLNVEERETEREAVKAIAHSIARKSTSVGEFYKEFEATIKDVTQPQGGTENFTNVRSPGAPPGKIPAEPGRSGSSGVGSGRGERTYPTDQYQTMREGGYINPSSEGSPDYSIGGKNPNYRINRQTPGQNWEQVGKVGERGGTSSIPTYEDAISPGKKPPIDQYSGTGPTPTKPSLERPQGEVGRPASGSYPSLGRENRVSGRGGLTKGNVTPLNTTQVSYATEVMNDGKRVIKTKWVTPPAPALPSRATLEKATSLPGINEVTNESVSIRKSYRVLREDEEDAVRLPGQPTYPDTDTSVTSASEEEADRKKLDEAARLEYESTKLQSEGEFEEAKTKKLQAMQLRNSLQSGTLKRMLRERSFVGTVR